MSFLSYFSREARTRRLLKKNHEKVVASLHNARSILVGSREERLSLLAIVLFERDKKYGVHRDAIPWQPFTELVALLAALKLLIAEQRIILRVLSEHMPAKDIYTWREIAADILDNAGLLRMGASSCERPDEVKGFALALQERATTLQAQATVKPGQPVLEWRGNVYPAPLDAATIALSSEDTKPKAKALRVADFLEFLRQIPHHEWLVAALKL